MKSVAKYRRFAEEYRKLSDKLDNPNDKKALQLMARAWDSVAKECEDRFISKALRGTSRSHCQETWVKLGSVSQSPQNGTRLSALAIIRPCCCGKSASVTPVASTGNLPKAPQAKLCFPSRCSS